MMAFSVRSSFSAMTGIGMVLPTSYKNSFSHDSHRVYFISTPRLFDDERGLANLDARAGDIDTGIELMLDG